MRKLLIIAAVLFTTSQTFAVGGIWFLEVEYDLNLQTQKGYIEVFYWPKPYEKYVGKDAEFAAEFHRIFEKEEEVIVYKEIVDQELLAKAATFPMHPFFIVKDSKTMVPVKKLKNISLKKVWVKNDYTVNVLTMLQNTDIKWISGNAEKEFPIGEQAGCRLQVHNFGNSTDYPPILKEVTTLYLKKDSLSLKETNRFKALLQKLKIRKVVVVNVCGC